MGISPGSQRSKTPTSLAEINVTPLVDVMLVLLIIFMVCAPLMQQGVQVDLPKANAGSMDDIPDQVLVVVTKSEEISMNGNVIKRGTLHTKLSAIAQVKPDAQVFIQADKGVAYGFVAQVIAEVKQAGLSKVGLVTDPGDAEKRL